MNTALRRSLPEDKYQRLKEAAITRFGEIKNDGQRTELYNNLSRYEKRADNDYSDRVVAPSDPKHALKLIFQLKNSTLGIVRSVKRFLLARVVKDLFGSEPFFFVKPEGPADKELSLRMQKHAGWKLRLAKYREKIKRAIDQVFDVGFCPVKTTWDVKEDVSERLAMILVFRQDGAPVMTADGDYIYEDDETMELQPETPGPEDGTTGGDTGTTGDETETGMDPASEEAGEPSPGPSVTVFAKAPEIVMDDGKYEWREHLVEERIRIYNGLRIDPCDRKDVYWPMNVADLEDADMVAHQYDCKLSELRARYAKGSYSEDEETGRQGGGETGDDDGEAPASVGGQATEKAKPDAEVMAILERLKNGSSTPKSEATQPRDGEGGVASGQTEDPVVLVAECSFDFDCFEDGILRRLHLVLLPEEQECIYAEYRAVLAPMAAKNIHLLAINRPKNRAYGRGLYEVYEELADKADELLNGILRRNEYNAKPKVVWSPHNTVEGKAKPNLKFWDTETITPDNSQLQPKDIAYTIELPDLDERTWQLMELFMQMIQLDSGVTNANQGDVTDLPSNSTATGINSMLESSSVLHQFILEEIRDGLTDQLSFAIGLIYLRQDDSETYEYLEGDGADGVMALSDARKLRHLPMNVEILLTRAKQQEQREAALAGIPMGVQYGQLPPPDQTRMRDAFVQLFRALGFDEPDKFFPVPDPNVQPPPPPPPRATEAISLKGADLTPSQKDALVQQMGLPAAKPEELRAQTETGEQDEGTAPAAPVDNTPLPANVVPTVQPGAAQPAA